MKWTFSVSIQDVWAHLQGGGGNDRRGHGGGAWWGGMVGGGGFDPAAGIMADGWLPCGKS
jgi:hypothetical protein